MSLPLPSAVQAALASGSLTEVLAATLAHFGCQAGSIHLLAPSGHLELAASHGIPPQVLGAVQTVPIGKGIAGLAAERLEPITICNLQTDTSGQAKAGARATGLEGTVAVPMQNGAGALRGVLGIGKITAYDWPKEETDLLSAIGQALAEQNITG